MPLRNTNQQTHLRYLFSSEIDGSLDEVQTTILLTTSCLHYICQHHHDTNVSKDDVQQGVTYGFYRCHVYAESMWFPLVQQCLILNGSKPIPSELSQSLETLAARRSAGESGDEEETSQHPTIPDFDGFKSQSPIVYKLLVRAAEFRRRCGSAGFQIAHGQ